MPKTENKYDIFISYRRVGGAQYARILQLMLIQRGYRVFLDYDELTDGIFGDHIKAAIKAAPVFMLVLSEGSMRRCVNEDDWVRQEILLAIELGKHLVPVNPDNSFDGFPDDKESEAAPHAGSPTIPKVIRDSISLHQFSEIGFGQTLGVTIDLMVKNRLVPTLGERNAAVHVDTDYAMAQETLRRQDAHNKFMRRLSLAGVAAVVLMVLATCLWFWHDQHRKQKMADEAATLDKLRMEIEERHKDFGLQFSPNLTAQQMNTIDTLLQNMIAVRPDTLWMSQFEFTVGQWYGIKGEVFDDAQRHMPMTNVSYGDIYLFLGGLVDMTNLNFSLPSAEEWEYAARGGTCHESTLYAGSNDPDSVAWFKDNSGNQVHATDGQQGKAPNRLDLYDMSGNVSELCNTPLVAHVSERDMDNIPFAICGGNYLSLSSEVTVTSCAPFSTGAKSPTVGFRIVIRKE